MFIAELTVDDLMLLEQFRIERLRSFFAENLLQCLIYVDRQHRLVIHCPEPPIVDTLLTDLQELCDYAWLIIGVKTIAIFFVQEEICRVKHGSANRSTPMIRR
jgi:hypothetical protein